MSAQLRNKESSLLSSEDNNLLFQIIGSKCQSLSTAVVQLFLTSQPNHDRWIKKCTGVLCFIRDQLRRSYFFRVYCLQRKCLLWEQELYDMIDYQSFQDFMHYFEAENCMCAFNFVSKEESINFKNAVINKLLMRKQSKGVSRNRKSKDLNNVSTISKSSTNSDHVSDQLSVQNHSQNSFFASSFSLVNKNTLPKKKLKRRLNKSEISEPFDWKHITYVKLDVNGKIDTNEPVLENFFKEAGVSEQHLNDTNTRNFIYQFIDDIGGLDAIKKDISEDNLLDPKSNRSNTNVNNQNDFENDSSPPPVPARNFNSKSSISNRPLPPSPNRTLKNQHVSKNSIKTPVMTQKLPRIGAQLQSPPPPPPPPPPPSQISSCSTTVPTAPVLNYVPQIGTGATSIVPPPPLPPPAPPVPLFASDGCHSKNVGADNTINLATDTRSALLNSIKSGIALKHIEPVEKSIDSPRTNLLNEIRHGVELKSVQPIERSYRSEGDSLAATLAKALAERARAIRSDTESSSSSMSGDDDDDDDDDDWDD